MDRLAENLRAVRERIAAAARAAGRDPADVHLLAVSKTFPAEDVRALVALGQRHFAENRVQEISDISRSLKALARELEIPVVALSQLSRASEQRGGERKPILSDLRDSGAIEQDADLVIFIHRAEYYDREDESKRGMAEIMLSKNRNGPTGDIQLRFSREYTRFDNFSAREEAE